MGSEGFADHRDLALLSHLMNNIHVLCFASEASKWKNPSEKLRVVSGREHTMGSIRIQKTHRVHGSVMFFGNNTTQTHRSSTLGS